MRMNKKDLHKNVTELNGMDKIHRERWNKLRLVIADFGTEEELKCIDDNNEIFFKVFTQGYSDGFSCGIEYLSEQLKELEILDDLDYEDFGTMQ